jgi:hypothetical protein
VGERLTIVLEDGVSEMLLKLAGGSRKQGEYLSKVIKSLYAGSLDMHEGGELEQIRLTMAGIAAKLKEHDARLLQLERGQQR